MPESIRRSLEDLRAVVAPMPADRAVYFALGASLRWLRYTDSHLALREWIVTHAYKYPLPSPEAFTALAGALRELLPPHAGDEHDAVTLLIELAERAAS